MSNKVEGGTTFHIPHLVKVIELEWPLLRASNMCADACPNLHLGMIADDITASGTSVNPKVKHSHEYCSNPYRNNNRPRCVPVPLHA